MINKLLIANRGEIARRIMRTAHSMGISCVAVYSDADRLAPHVREADQAVHLPGTAAADTYLRADLIVEAALATGADAVHPGYGFLSEAAHFAEECLGAGLIFVGPPPSAIAQMGSKLAAKEVLSAAGVPVLASIEVSPSMDPRELEEAAYTVGWPILVKASFGGGGRGMRIVRSPEGLQEAVDAASREAASAFGDGTVFLERYLEAPHHIEIQIMADAYGNVVHLGERECSIQRRHQKIIEESPSPLIDEATRQEMGAVAVRAAKTIGYIGAGTCEFLAVRTDRAGNGGIAREPKESFGGAGGVGAGSLEGGAGGVAFYFLEMNTRLQVEHPVTEMVTDMDLVRLQILIAEGEPLPREVFSPAIKGHAIEARLYAEDPESSWMPSVGKLYRFDLPQLEGVRLDSGVESGDEISPYYDPMLAKVIAHAPTRHEAARKLARALSTAHIHGLVTNRDLLVGILTHEEFLSGDTSTAFLERNDPAELSSSRQSKEGEQLSALAAALSAQAERRRDAKVMASLPSGWRNNPSQLQQSVYEGRRGRIEVGYRFDRRGKAVLAIDGELRSNLELEFALPGVVAIEEGGTLHHFEVHRVDRRVFIDSDYGSYSLIEADRFPLPEAEERAGSLTAPMPGTVVKVLTSSGEQVSEGQALVVLEAMKMEHAIAAPHSGTVTDLLVTQGSQVQAGAPLVVLAKE